MCKKYNATPDLLCSFLAAQDSYGGHMVAFAGRKYAARSVPAFVANGTYTVTSFTLVRILSVPCV